MPKRTIDHEQYSKILREAEEVRQLLDHPGWKTLEADLKRDQAKLRDLLVENRLRTVSETLTTANGTRTIVTTAETQIAENAGLYKQIEQIFRRNRTMLEAPEKLRKLEEKGVVTIEKPKEEKP